MKKLYLLAISLLSGSLPLLAQQEAALHSMRSLPQAHYTNPAIAPTQQAYVGLPGISSTFISISNSGFNYNGIVERDQEKDLRYLDLNRMQKNLADRNYLTANVQTDLLSFGFKANARLYLTFNSTLKTFTRLMYPKGLIGLAVNGNAAYLDQTVAFSPMIDHISYLENAVGASYRVDQKLQLGARIKYLKGLANVRTQTSDFTLTTDAESYALHLKGNLQVQTAGMYEFIEGNKEPEDLAYGDFTSNGVAVDLGAIYKVNHRLEVGFSALNLGAINWKSQTREYYLEDVSVSFKGLDVADIFNGGDGLKEFEDEIEEKFDLKDRSLESYRTGIPSHYYLSARFELHRNLHASGLFFAEHYNGRLMPAFSAALNKDFGRHLSTSLSYTMVNRSYNNIGAGLSFRLTPFQLYLVSDNLISAPIFYRSAKALDLRLGLNLVFGYQKSPAKLPFKN